jgi:hypothetical protein
LKVRRWSARFLSLLIVLSVVALSFVLAACGGDDDAGDSGSGDAVATSPAGGGGNSADRDDEDGGDEDDAAENGDGGDGSATLTIGDEVWEFERVLCAFSLEESQTEDYPFNLSAFGESATGNRIQLTSDIRDPSGEGRYAGDGVTYRVEVDDIDDFENPSVSWGTNDDEIFGGSPVDFQVDGNEVNASGVFDDGLTEDAMEAVPGTLVAVCP